MALAPVRRKIGEGNTQGTEGKDRRSSKNLGKILL